MHDGATRKVKRTLLPQPASSRSDRLEGFLIRDCIRTIPEPDHVRHGDVAKGKPDHREKKHCRKLHPFSKSANNERAGNRRKGRLESNKNNLWDVDAFAEGCPRRIGGYAGQKKLVESADEG